MANEVHEAPKTTNNNTHKLSTQEEALYNTTELGRILKDFESVEQKIQKNAKDAMKN
ncbi:hypothetical protein [Candidatus Rickettsia colombianensi]|uniref:hypothetical protein n=1 Tax=Candidatus Rickettsia colombianensi TaxID=1090944 RepID=UPI0015B0709E|nr:hypothetical protein [Candidatus Rickettsia colombianensi]